MTKVRDAAEVDRGDAFQRFRGKLLKPSRAGVARRVEVLLRQEVEQADRATGGNGDGAEGFGQR